jgi:hypothetical protein
MQRYERRRGAEAPRQNRAQKGAKKDAKNTDEPVFLFASFESLFAPFCELEGKLNDAFVCTIL